MTVESTTRRAQYDTNGTTGPWTVPFYFLANADLEVIHTDVAGVETTLTLTTHYSVTGAGVPSGGAVTTVASYSAGGTITVLRSVAILQETDYVETDAFPAAAHETALDRLTMIAQQQAEKIDRALVFPPADGEADALPAVASRLDRMLGFNASSGAAEMTAFTQTQVASAIAAAYGTGSTADAITFIASGTGATGRTAQNKMRETVSVLDFGADSTGVTSSTAAFQAAINALPAPYGGTILVPAGKYYLATGLSWSDRSVRFVGVANGIQPNTGTVIDVASGVTPFTMQNGVLGYGAYSGLENLHVVSRATGATTGVGVLVQCRSRIVNCTFEHFGSHGVHVLSGGSTVAGIDPNIGYFEQVRCFQNYGYGAYVQGVDSNANTFVNLDCTGNALGGLRDDSFLGNTYIGPHFAGNGVCGAYLGTSFGVASINTRFVSAYKETDGLPGVIIDAGSNGYHNIDWLICADPCTDNGIVPSRITGRGDGGVVTSNMLIGPVAGAGGSTKVVMTTAAVDITVPTTVAAAGGFSATETGVGAAKYAVRGYSSSAAYTGSNFYSNSATAAAGGAGAGDAWNHFLGQSAGGTVTNVVVYGNGNIKNTNNSYGAISDRKLKRDIVDATPKLNKLMQVRVVNFALKTDPDFRQIGVIAQELEQVFPSLVSDDLDGATDGVRTKSVKYSIFVPILIKALQEQQALIESLTGRVAAMEAQP